jgi:hypothetical protein
MSLESIESALSRAATQIKPGQPHYPSLFEDDGITPKRPFLPSWIVDPVRQEIENTPQLLELAQRWIRDPSSGQQLSPWNVAQALVYRLFAGSEPAQIVSDLMELANRAACDVWTYIGLYGGGISDELRLAEDIRVMPAQAAPPSLARELIFGVDRWDRPIFDTGFPLLLVEPTPPDVASLIRASTDGAAGKPDAALLEML